MPVTTGATERGDKVLFRISVSTIITGLAFLAMGWIDPAGPLLMVVGALLGALDLERRLDLETPQRTSSMPTVASSGEHRRAA